MPTITSAGVGSGLDIQGIVSQLVSAERTPTASRLDSKEATFQTQISGLGALKGALSSFQTAVQGLEDASIYTGRKATSSDTNYFTASSDSTAVAGVYDIKVVSLAKSQQLASKGFDSLESVVGTGTLSITKGGGTTDISITSENSTLQGIRDAINQANIGVSASTVKVDKLGGGSEYKLVLASTSPGTDNSIQINTTDDDGNHTDTSGLSQLVYQDTGTQNIDEWIPAQDAVIRLFNQDITRSSNTISDAIQGVTINLVDADQNKSLSLSVTQDNTQLTTKLRSVVDSYNALQSLSHDLGYYNSQTGQRGALIGDATLRSVQNSVANIMQSQTLVGDYTLTRLADLGISLDDSGKMSLDTGKLTDAANKNPNQVQKLLSDSTSGFSTKLNSTLDGYLKSNGVLTSRIDSLNTQVDLIGKQREDLDARMTNLQTRLLKQFTDLDQLVSRFQSTGNYLTQHFASSSR